MNFLEKIYRKFQSAMESKAIESMNERELNAYLNHLNRLKSGQLEQNLEDGEFIPAIGNISTPVDLIKEITIVREALKRIRRVGATDEEKKAAMKRYMGFECTVCHNVFSRLTKVIINGQDYCSGCAKGALNGS